MKRTRARKSALYPSLVESHVKRLSADLVEVLRKHYSNARQLVDFPEFTRACEVVAEKLGHPLEPLPAPQIDHRVDESPEPATAPSSHRVRDVA